MGGLPGRGPTGPRPCWHLRPPAALISLNAVDSCVNAYPCRKPATRTTSEVRFFPRMRAEDIPARSPHASGADLTFATPKLRVREANVKSSSTRNVYLLVVL